MQRPPHTRRLLIAAGVAAVFVVPAALLTTSSGNAAPATAAQIQYAPINAKAPTISGTAAVGQTLTASVGTWTSSSAVTYAYQWERCNTAGTSCANIASATGTTYAVAAADAGSTLRVVVSGKNKDGTTNAISAATAAVPAAAPAGPAGATKEANGRTSVPVASLALPDRLTVDQVQFSPNPVRTETAITARFHVTNTKGYDVRDALVYAIGLPYSRVTTAPEAKSGTDGWATIAFQPAKLFPRKGYITFFVRARPSGGDPLAGISTRRLVQVTINR
jgi:hypothetical protein